jgi:thiol-disulfide isomerase/thioredoxin
VLVVVLVAASAFGIWRRRTDGRLRPGASAGVIGSTDDPGELQVVNLEAGDLGFALGRRATLVQFSTVFCQPCRATRRILGEVAAMVPGVVHIDVDAESHLDLVRRLDVRRTPTVLLVDPAGRVVRRAVGAPRKADVISALGELVVG